MSKRPIVGFIGPIDHGKTSLIEAIRAAFGGGKWTADPYFEAAKDGRSVMVYDVPGNITYNRWPFDGHEPLDVVVLAICGDGTSLDEYDDCVRFVDEQERQGKKAVVAATKADTRPDNGAIVRAMLFAGGLGDWPVVDVSVNVRDGTSAGLPQLMDAILA